jgi:hypothetical protein
LGSLGHRQEEGDDVQHDDEHHVDDVEHADVDDRSLVTSPVTARGDPSGRAKEEPPSPDRVDAGCSSAKMKPQLRRRTT